MIPLLTGNLWKIATGAAALITVILFGALVHTYFDNKELDRAKTELTERINDPKTGYIVQLAQARTNEATLRVEVEKQTQAYKKLSTESNAKLAEAERKYALAQAETRRVEKQVAKFMAQKPQGDTLEDRVLDVDERALKEMIK